MLIFYARIYTIPNLLIMLNNISLRLCILEFLKTNWKHTLSCMISIRDIVIQFYNNTQFCFCGQPQYSKINNYKKYDLCIVNLYRVKFKHFILKQHTSSYLCCSQQIQNNLFLLIVYTYHNNTHPATKLTFCAIMFFCTTFVFRIITILL